jgi:cytosine/adenosine deaminase-related metal-dependent hydrolase
MTITALINALIVLPPGSAGGEPRITTLRFDQRRVLSLDKVPQRGDHVIDLHGCTVYPGLVNAHDHLELNHYPRTKFRDVYTNTAQWAADFTPQLDREPFRSLRQMPLAAQCLIGGEKNALSGVTTVAHHNPLHHPLRRRDFPLRVVRRYGWAHSFALETDASLQASYRRIPADAPWCLHLAEGTDESAAAELSRLISLGLLRPNTLLIHGVGLTEADRQRIINNGAGLVWCPSSNFFLLGQTANVAAFSESHRLALGSDSRLTADGDLLDELRAAFATGQLTAAQLFRAVTIDAAALLRAHGAGDLAVGSLPDLFVIQQVPADPYRALIDLRPADLAMRWLAGKRQ